MARTPEGARLTEEHRRAQLQVRARALRDLALLWRVVDATNLSGTIGPWAAAASVLLRARHRDSAVLAAGYYLAFREAEGVRGVVDAMPAEAMALEVIAGHLRGAALSGIVNARRAGFTPEAASQRGLVKASGVATRALLDGARDTIIGTGSRDPEGGRWQRITSGDPCAFCAMLASRGPAYSTQDTASFKAHDHCSCVPEIAYPGSALPPESQRFQEQWKKAQREIRRDVKGTKNDALNAFRRLREGRVTSGQSGEVILVCGPPAAGKSTWVKERAKPGDQIIDYDEIAQSLGSPDRHDHPEEIRKAARRAREAMEAEAAKRAGRTWVIRSLPDAADRQRVAEQLSASQVVVLATPEEECLRRAAADNRPDWTSEVITSWWRRYTADTTETPTRGPQTRQGRGEMPEGKVPVVTSQASDTDDKDWKAEAEKWKALARKHEDQAKANYAELEKLKTASDSSKSEVDKLAERLAAAEKRLAEADARAMRAEVAAVKGLTEAQARRLQGSTREELEADADELLSLFRPADGDKADKAGEPAGDDGGKGGDDTGGKLTVSRRPQEILRTGAAPATEGDLDGKKADELAEEILSTSF